MPPSRGNDLHGCRLQLHECTHSNGYGGARHSAADAPDAALTAASRQHGFTIKFTKWGGGKNHAVPAAADAVCSATHGFSRPA